MGCQFKSAIGNEILRRGDAIKMTAIQQIARPFVVGPTLLILLFGCIIAGDIGGETGNLLFLTLYIITLFLYLNYPVFATMVVGKKIDLIHILYIINTNVLIVIFSSFDNEFLSDNYSVAIQASALFSIIGFIALCWRLSKILSDSYTRAPSIIYQFINFILVIYIIFSFFWVDKYWQKLFTAK